MPTAPGPLQFGTRTYEPAARTLGEMREVLADPSFLHYADLKRPVYFMYRGLYLSERDGALLKEQGLRYDITVIPPGTLGKEFVKTLGHDHPPAPGTGLTYPELYEVLEGAAHYLLQRAGGDGKIEDAVLVRAQAGAKVLIPPGYGHVTINPARKVLRMANLVADGFESLYEPYRQAGGAAYFGTTDGRFIPNPRRGSPPPLREARPSREMAREGEVYGWFRKAPDDLAFLTRPQEFADLWKRALR